MEGMFDDLFDELDIDYWETRNHTYNEPLNELPNNYFKNLNWGDLDKIHLESIQMKKKE